MTLPIITQVSLQYYLGTHLVFYFRHVKSVIIKYCRLFYNFMYAHPVIAVECMNVVKIYNTTYLNLLQAIVLTYIISH